MYSHEEIKPLASHIALRIIPELFSHYIAPSQAKPEAERYFRLADELEKITHEIINSDFLQNEVKTSAGKTAVLVS
jgi:hypothetical protein